MARVHLFRGFHSDENGTAAITINGKQIKGEWVKGNLFIPDNPNTPTQICMGKSIIRICYEVLPEPVGEFTGLTDKNGKKIFEHDIVKITDEIVNGIYYAYVAFGNPNSLYTWGWQLVPLCKTPSLLKIILAA